MDKKEKKEKKKKRKEKKNKYDKLELKGEEIMRFCQVRSQAIKDKINIKIGKKLNFVSRPKQRLVKSVIESYKIKFKAIFLD